MLLFIVVNSALSRTRSHLASSCGSGQISCNSNLIPVANEKNGGKTMLSSDVQIAKKPSSKKADTLGVYLQEMGRIPRLTPEQEIFYGKSAKTLALLEAARSGLELQLQRPPSLSEWSKYANLSVSELESSLSKGRQAKDTMVKSNLRLVVSIAKRYQNRNLEILDLIQEGSIGLERAVEKFDPEKGYRFSTYAYHWIRQAITREIATNGRTIRLPIHANEKLNKIKKVQRQLSQKLGHTPSTTEIAHEMDCRKETVETLLEANRQTKPVSLSIRIGIQENGELEQQIEDKATPCPIDHAEARQMENRLAKALKYISPKQKEILILRYGLRGGKGLSHKKIGDRVNLSLDQVRRMEKEALKRLRVHFENHIIS